MADKKKMSVADILAAARKTDGGGDDAVAGSASEEEGGGAAAKKPAAKKAAAKKPAATKPAAAKAAPAEPRDTASILAAARKSSKAGPMSKAEAAAKEKADPKAKAKPRIIVPPMPEKPAYAMSSPTASASALATGKAKGKKGKGAASEERRDFLWVGFAALAAVTGIFSLASLKFMFPNVRREPPSKFKVGFPDAYPAGQVQTKFKAQYGVWIANAEYDGQSQIYALKSVCTHLGCTPSWLDAEQKYKCPCHGSGFYKDGINFEGPAPRPLERCAIRIADDGQIEVDKSRIFQEEMGQWEDPSCYISV